MNIVDILNNQLKGKRIFINRYKLKHQTKQSNIKIIYNYHIEPDGKDAYKHPYWEVLEVTKVEVTINTISGYYDIHEGNYIYMTFTSLEGTEYNMSINLDQDMNIKQ